MRKFLVATAIVASITLGCAQSDDVSSGGEATPIPGAKDDQITNMDFESGEVEQPAEVTDGQEAEPAPDTE
jgi:hypothetical protein